MLPMARKGARKRHLEHVPSDDLDSGIAGEAPPQPGHQQRVDLDGDQAPRRRGKLARERPLARSDLEDQFVQTYSCNTNEFSRDPRAEKVPAAPRPRSSRGHGRPR
jgi:hypothetical protein